MQVKLCGFSEEKSLQVAIEENCNFLGFVFVEKSPRFVTLRQAAQLAKKVPSHIAKVAVVVDADFDYIKEIVANLAPDFFQFHGHESVEFLREFKNFFPQIKIIKAFAITNSNDLIKVKEFEEIADFILFDSKIAGSGTKFDWKILQNFSCKKNWFLSGGLNVHNIDEALITTGAQLIDLSSGIEEIRGQKSPKLIREFMAKIRNHNV